MKIESGYLIWFLLRWIKKYTYQGPMLKALLATSTLYYVHRFRAKHKGLRYHVCAVICVVVGFVDSVDEGWS